MIEEQTLSPLSVILVTGVLPLIAAIAGAIVGGLIGRKSALHATELKAKLDRELTERTVELNRRYRRADFVRSLHTEVSLAKRALDNALTAYDTEEARTRAESDRPPRPRGPLFTKDVYRGCIRDLGMLPEQLRFDLQNFYACLDDVEFFLRQAELWVRLHPDEQRFTYRKFVDTMNTALASAVELLPELGELAPEGPADSD